MDGDGVKGSTNGTWLFAREFVDLEDNDTIKAAQIVMQASLLESI